MVLRQILCALLPIPVLLVLLRLFCRILGSPVLQPQWPLGLVDVRGLHSVFLEGADLVSVTSRCFRVENIPQLLEKPVGQVEVFLTTTQQHNNNSAINIQYES